VSGVENLAHHVVESSGFSDSEHSQAIANAAQEVLAAKGVETIPEVNAALGGSYVQMPEQIITGDPAHLNQIDSFKEVSTIQKGEGITQTLLRTGEKMDAHDKVAFITNELGGFRSDVDVEQQYHDAVMAWGREHREFDLVKAGDEIGIDSNGNLEVIHDGKPLGITIKLSAITTPDVAQVDTSADMSTPVVSQVETSADVSTVNVAGAQEIPTQAGIVPIGSSLESASIDHPAELVPSKAPEIATLAGFEEGRVGTVQMVKVGDKMVFRDRGFSVGFEEQNGHIRMVPSSEAKIIPLNERTKIESVVEGVSGAYAHDVHTRVWEIQRLSEMYNQLAAQPGMEDEAQAVLNELNSSAKSIDKSLQTYGGHVDFPKIIGGSAAKNMSRVVFEQIGMGLENEVSQVDASETEQSVPDEQVGNSNLLDTVQEAGLEKLENEASHITLQFQNANLGYGENLPMLARGEVRFMYGADGEVQGIRSSVSLSGFNTNKLVNPDEVSEYMEKIKKTGRDISFVRDILDNDIRTMMIHEATLEQMKDSGLTDSPEYKFLDEQIRESQASLTEKYKGIIHFLSLIHI